MKWDRVYDIVFVGAGTAGLAGAIQAVKNGDKPLVLELAEPCEFRSSLSVIAGVMNFVGTKYQEELGIEDSAEQYAMDLVNSCGGEYNLCKAMTDQLHKTLEFVENDLGLIPSGVIGGSGHSVGRCHLFDGPKVIGRLEAKALEMDIEIAWGTPGKELVHDRAHGVLGIIAEKGGQKITIRARKGVVLCTGGFGYNKKFCKEFGPDHFQDLIRLMPPTHIGLGLKMALRIGAATRDIKHGLKCSLPTCIHTLADTSIQFLGGVVVNKSAKRFIREDTWYGYLGDAGAKQLDGIFYIIYDEAIRSKTKKEFPTWLRHKEFKGNTIEELAKELKLDTKTLKATLENYNEMAAEGHDTECGRTTLDGNFGSPVQLTNGPFYGMECKPSTTSSKGGIRIDSSNRVLDWDGRVIPRLYAAGEVSGGYFGKGGYIWGTMTVMSLTCGAIAANDAHKNNPFVLGGQGESEYFSGISKAVVVDHGKCVGCKICVNACTCRLLVLREKFPQPREEMTEEVERRQDLVRYKTQSCANCRVCITACPKGAIDIMVSLPSGE